MGEDGESSKGAFSSRFADSIAKFKEDSDAVPYKNTSLLQSKDEVGSNTSSGAERFHQAVRDTENSSGTRNQ